jgi:ABC-2 type transport system permease protein
VTNPEAGEGAGYWIPYAAAMILYIVIIMASSLLRSSLGDERKNRVLEILMVSLSPRQILTGKIVALAIVGLLQTAAWAGTGYVLLRMGGGTINLPPTSQIPVTVVLWALVFFVLGYGVYASLLAGIGALTGPNVPGSSTADFVIIWPLIIPIFFMTIIIPNANGALAVVLSMFPPTAPVAMITRLAVGGIPWCIRCCPRRCSRSLAWSCCGPWQGHSARRCFWLDRPSPSGAIFRCCWGRNRHVSHSVSMAGAIGAGV